MKFKALKTRAKEKIEQVAADLGLSGEELADRLVPDFGLDTDGSTVVDYGPGASPWASTSNCGRTSWTRTASGARTCPSRVPATTPSWRRRNASGSWR
ncbi:hypothetical protein SAZ11_01355 [Streptomyces sp. FXJ1.4098]|nr:hypothetical protein [Streptomyces sp. FXJ1.4098]